MPIVNACLGGLANAVPSGQARLNLTWITNDGENQQVTFVISGTASKSVQSDANGYASVQLPVGTYTVSVTHGGEYLGDDPKSITLTSRGTGTLTWLTGARNAQVVTFASPGALSTSSASYTITQGGTSVASGSSWNSTMTFNLYGGSYTLTVNAYGDSFTHEFTVPKNTGLTQDLSDKFCKLTIGGSGYSVRNLTVRGYSVSGTSSYAPSYPVCVIRSSKSATIGGTVNTPTPPRYSGASTASVYTFHAYSTSVTPNSASKSASISVSKVANLVFITSDGTLTVPDGTYEVLVNGGGGATLQGTPSGGCTGSYGGEIKRYVGALSGSYNIVLGAGGVSNSIGPVTSAGASSFGTLISASGGSPGSSAPLSDAVGVAGGGLCRYVYGLGTGGNGCNTSGDIGGGGGGGGCAYPKGESATGKGTGGSAGNVFGGAGGNGASSGKSGTSVEIDTTYLAQGGYGGSYAVIDQVSCYGGGGGGGGYGAYGGEGGKEDVRGAGGGGGGGALGGTGGKGGSFGPGRVDTVNGMHGRGYGSGAGGTTYYWNERSYSGGGGGGGIGSTMVESSSSLNGAKGCVAIWWKS